MQECIAPYYFHNGTAEACDRFDLRWVYEGESIYEVIRVQEGVALFLEDHIQRLVRTADLRNVKLPADFTSLSRDIRQYIDKISLDEGNLKVVFNHHPMTGKDHYLIYRIHHHYPSEEMYRNGVQCLIHYAERFQPQAKVINAKLRNTIFRRLIEAQYYEALLVDRDNRITEGSRSNVFFIRDGVLYTAPEQRVLPGISRAHVLHLARERKFPVLFEAVPVEQLGTFETVFLTGTSIRILPVSEVDEFRFSPSHPMIRDLSSDYEQLVQQYIKMHPPGSGDNKYASAR